MSTFSNNTSIALQGNIGVGDSPGVGQYAIVVYKLSSVTSGSPEAFVTIYYGPTQTVTSTISVSVTGIVATWTINNGAGLLFKNTP